MRYQDSETAKTYSANPRNLSETEDAAPAGPASTGKSPSAAKKPSPKGTKSASPPISSSEQATWGPKRISTEVPAELIEVAVPADGIVEIYTDGACSGNPGPCGYGVVLRDGDSYMEIKQHLGIGTNNIGELMAIKVALENVEDKGRPVRLYTDSTYCIGVLTKNWKAKANQELIKETKAVLADFDDLVLIKVKGHAGHPLNERADYLATSAIK
ncbi:MAG: ribonuclease HI [Bradymonadaceae bacterium]|nr:ribonuclease HI [Lujinxingiaceae bacterium]